MTYRANNTLNSNISPFQCDVLLVTVTRVEAEAVLTAVREATGAEFKRQLGRSHKTYYDLGLIGGARTCMVRSEMGSGGSSGSQSTVQAGIEDLAPSAVIGVGIAFGTKPDKQQIGDILISQHLQAYDFRRESIDAEGRLQTIPRGYQVEASPRLLDRFRHGELFWQDSKLKFGLLLTGSALIDSLEFRNQLLESWPEAIGGEMEGAGIHDAAFLHKVDWIIVKAICDWADGNKKINDENVRQQKAASNAATFVISVLQQGEWVESNHQAQQVKSLDITTRLKNLKPDVKILGVLRSYYEANPGDPKMSFRSLLESSEIIQENAMLQLIGLKEKKWIDYELTESAETGFVWLTQSGVKVTENIFK